MEKEIRKEYWNLFRAAFWGLLKEMVGWRDYLLLLLSLIIGAVFSYWWKGRDYMIDEVMSFVGWAALPFLALLIWYGIILTRDTLVKIYKQQKEKADLYTPEGIQIIAFNPEEFDTRPAGLLVTNKKGQTIRGCAQVDKFFMNGIEVADASKQYLLNFDDNYAHFAYCSFENDTPKLLLLEKIRRESDEYSHCILWTNKEPYLEVREHDNNIVEINFWFIINNLYLKHWIVQCKLENESGRLKVTKIKDWLDKRP